ncbi:type IV pilus assembly protein PilM [Methylophilus rhizosphaerae]|uniref:Type IV pilus assembly protein PilM n=1 Tax=Methylophilus rhizosphaerae TaxID=492660 RepID=A0A1G9E306_9PROT|nr:pilus assembly protein PilM [Methylophilus rhizosphaerae]SDK70512.1 type IV pilus assembly protein PilM [Methylophilus rhizosphaerae]
MNLGFLQRKKTSFIGVDVSATAIKMVELSAIGKHQFRLDGYASVALPKGVISDGNISDLAQVADTMRSTWRLLGSRARQVVLALPASAVISKRVIMPAGMRDEDMELQVESEAHQYIPFPLDEMNLDFQVLGPIGKADDEVEVLIVAAKKEKIDDRVAVAEEAGLKVSIVDVDAYATETAYRQILRQLPDHSKKTVTMILDIGAYVTHINVMVGTHSIYAREQAFGGAMLSQEIQRRFGLSPEESEIAKRQGGLPESYEQEVLQPFLQNLASEAARAVSFFISSTQYNKVDHVLLAGGVAATDGLAALIAEKTGIHTLVANPFQGMSLVNKIKASQLETDAPALMIACGLALRGVEA